MISMWRHITHSFAVGQFHCRTNEILCYISTGSIIFTSSPGSGGTVLIDFTLDDPEVISVEEQVSVPAVFNITTQCIVLQSTDATEKMLLMVPRFDG